MQTRKIIWSQTEHTDRPGRAEPHTVYIPFITTHVLAVLYFSKSPKMSKARLVSTRAWAAFWDTHTFARSTGTHHLVKKSWSMTFVPTGLWPKGFFSDAHLHSLNVSSKVRWWGQIQSPSEEWGFNWCVCTHTGDSTSKHSLLFFFPSTQKWTLKYM